MIFSILTPWLSWLAGWRLAVGNPALLKFLFGKLHRGVEFPLMFVII